MSNSTLAPGANKEAWAQAAHNAQDAAASVGQSVSNAASAVGTMASNAACEVGKRADDLTASAGAGIHDFGDRLSHNAPHAGMLGTASQAVAKSVQDGGKYIEEHKLSGITGDVAHLIRQYPIPAVLIGIGLGCFVGRILKR